MTSLQHSEGVEMSDKKIHAMGAGDDGAVIGFMCLTDWECELGLALGGNAIYPDEQDCAESRKCTDSCGMVEVEVRFRRIVRQPKTEDA